jgi:predicted kinase
LQRRQALFEERLTKGCVREGHGDLRAEHIYFTPEGIQIIDCIEFNERMRFNDPASDVAFLLMDLDYQGAFGASQEVLEAFATRYGDLRIFSLIDFFLCYRACVRLKVTCFRLSQQGLGETLRRELLERARTFTALACRYAKRFSRPTVYVVMGVIASGKSTVARALADALDIRRLSSDRIRKSVFEDRAGFGAAAPYGKGIYRPEARSRVYGKMFLLASAQLENHRSVILDATFSGKKERLEALRLADDAGARIVFIECRSPEKIIRARLKSREAQAFDSDAGLSIFEAFKAHYEPPAEIPASARIEIDSTRPVVSLVREVLMACRQKLFSPALEAAALYNPTSSRRGG